MSIEPGSTLLHYRLLEQIGEGGMGVVWKAEDTSLGREVAIKVLPEAFTLDAKRLARFEREARLLATLNHPNISAVYGLHQADGVHFIAMELVPGEELTERIARGPIPLDELIDIGRQVAEGLEAAHDAGVIHRDLKPANVKIAPDGRIKVLDLGLAKGLSAPVDRADPAESPTMTSVGSFAGVILGTAAYMSPEQANGREVDRRADIWAFGVVLYEMATGRRLFEGVTVSETLAAVLRDPIDLGTLPASTPRRVRWLIQRCLDREPSRRLQAIGEARITLEDEASGVPDAGAEIVGVDRAPSSPTLSARKWRVTFVASAVVALVSIVASLTGLVGPVGSSKLPETRLVAEIAAPEGWYANSVDGPPVLSPDGQYLAFVAENAEQQTFVLVRDLHTGITRALEPTENAKSPFWSPDARHLGFFADGALKRIDIDGGSATTLAAATATPGGGAWSSDGRILFVSHFEDSQMLSVDENGGDVTVLPHRLPDAPTAWYAWPSFLPDGNRFLLTVSNVDGARDGIYLGAIDAADSLRRLMPGVANAAFVEPHWLIHWDHGSLIARKVDPRSLTPEGTFHRIAEDVAYSGNYMYARFTLSQNGLLLFQTVGEAVGDTELVLVDRDGHDVSSPGELAEYYTPRLSHDGKRIAVDITTLSGWGDVWTIDLDRGVRSRITRSEVDASSPVWTRDDRELIFFQGPSIKRRDASGAGAASVLLDNLVRPLPNDVSPDGRALLYTRASEGLWVLILETGETHAWLANGFDERIGRFSPDGRWVAYVSDQSGRAEIYLDRFPEPGQRIVVSNDGGRAPVWRADGKELFYVSTSREIVSVPIAWDGGHPQPGKPGVLFRTRLRQDEEFDVTPDGQRFLLNRVLPVDTKRPFVLEQNWYVGLGTGARE